MRIVQRAEAGPTKNNRCPRRLVLCRCEVFCANYIQEFSRCVASGTHVNIILQLNDIKPLSVHNTDKRFERLYKWCRLKWSRDVDWMDMDDGENGCNSISVHVYKYGPNHITVARGVRTHVARDVRMGQASRVRPETCPTFRRLTRWWPVLRRIVCND